MNVSQIYVVLSIVVLAVIALLVFFVSKNKKKNRLTPLAGIAFGFVLAGIFFGENRFIGYGLLGIGVLLAVVDIFNKLKKK
jgi:lipopolysaccharide export LptBFGC system permease protein LptF